MIPLKILFLPLFLALIALFFIPAYGDVLNVSTDKSVYNNGEKIIVSGKVKYNENIPSIIIQILNPAKNNFADIGNVIPKKDGTFSATFNTGGPTWTNLGIYTVKVSYAGISQTTFELKQIKSTTEKPPNQQNQNEKPIIKDTQKPTEEPKTHIPDFPSFDKSPQHYIDRYNNDPAYKSWFGSQFPGKTIEQVVGYEKTHIPNFPSLDKSPQYYIDRYNNEVDYKDWFDSQFPEQTIYNVLGFPNPSAIPNWIKIIAEWWSDGKIGDSDFLDGIEFMIQNNIIVIPDIPQSGTNSNRDVPSWIKNTAGWWADGIVPEDEFVSSLKFLIKQGIIKV